MPLLSSTVPNIWNTLKYEIFHQMMGTLSHYLWYLKNLPGGDRRISSINSRSPFTQGFIHPRWINSMTNPEGHGTVRGNDAWSSHDQNVLRDVRLRSPNGRRFVPQPKQRHCFFRLLQHKIWDSYKWIVYSIIPCILQPKAVKCNEYQVVLSPKQLGGYNFHYTYPLKKRHNWFTSVDWKLLRCEGGRIPDRGK